MEVREDPGGWGLSGSRGRGSGGGFEGDLGGGYPGEGNPEGYNLNYEKLKMPKMQCNISNP